MSTSKRSGGLGGVKAFTTPSSAAPTKPVEVTKTKEPEPTKVAKVRTTVTLYPKTLSAMERLKVELRKSGNKVTLSDVLEQAVWALMEKEGFKP